MGVFFLISGNFQNDMQSSASNDDYSRLGRLRPNTIPV